MFPDGWNMEDASTSKEMVEKEFNYVWIRLTSCGW